MASSPADLIAMGHRLALAAGAAYAGQVGPLTNVQPMSDPEFAALNLRDVATFLGPKTDTHGYIATGAADRVLAFRGSLTLPNWLVNVTFNWTPWLVRGAQRGRVHAGFADAWREVRDAVIRLLARDGGAPPLWLTGHSLGGALATLAAADLAAEGVPIAGVHTFGAPRVGDAAFAQGWNGSHERWVNHQDPVPLVPWSGPFVAGYVHTGRLQYLSADGRLSSAASLWKLFSEHASAMLKTQGPDLQSKVSAYVRARLADHDMGAYVRKLKALAATA